MQSLVVVWIEEHLRRHREGVAQRRDGGHGRIVHRHATQLVGHRDQQRQRERQTAQQGGGVRRLERQQRRGAATAGAAQQERRHRRRLQLVALGAVDERGERGNVDAHPVQQLADDVANRHQRLDSGQLDLIEMVGLLLVRLGGRRRRLRIVRKQQIGHAADATAAGGMLAGSTQQSSHRVQSGESVDDTSAHTTTTTTITADYILAITGGHITMIISSSSSSSSDHRVDVILQPGMINTRVRIVVGIVVVVGRTEAGRGRDGQDG